jgi:hypothetical protein
MWKLPYTGKTSMPTMSNQLVERRERSTYAQALQDVVEEVAEDIGEKHPLRYHAKLEVELSGVNVDRDSVCRGMKNSSNRFMIFQHSCKVEPPARPQRRHSDQEDLAVPAVSDGLEE